MKKQYNFSRGKRGPIIPKDPNKVRITIRLDADIIEYFKQQVHVRGGGNYQTMINNVLREYLSNEQESIDDKLRRVIREELRAAASPQ